MYKYLVVAVDGSQSALNALKHACALAKLSSAKLMLVHVANPTEYLALSPGFLQEAEYEIAAKEHGSTVLAEAKTFAEAEGAAEVGTHLLVSARGAKEMAYELVAYAHEEGADLLVLGTHGRSGLMHLLMGSFTETVMRQTKLPLLVIRSTEENQD